MQHLHMHLLRIAPCSLQCVTHVAAVRSFVPKTSLQLFVLCTCIGGVLFQPMLPDGEFRQYGDLPLATFVGTAP
jgi:hypothetical protein